MGSDAEVFVFKYETYITEVVPAFLQLLRDSSIVDWLKPFAERKGIQPELWDRTDLARFCNYLQPDFAYRGPYDLTNTYDFAWNRRSCKSVECPERDHCPFHQNGSEAIAEQITYLFRIAVSIKCLGPSQFVGRSWTVDRYAKLLTEIGVRSGDPVLDLLARLGKRGFIIGYRWGFGFEGINGWLDAAETAELANRLRALPLPEYESSFEAMKRFPSMEADGDSKFRSISFEILSLSFVRTVATIAAREHQAILWGNDVMPSQFYLE